IGRGLQELATELESAPDRWSRFRSVLQEVIAANPDRADWNEDLARQADRQGWPPWAVRCLPRLYIPLPDPSPQRHVAIIWRSLLDCVRDPENYSATSLCGGELREVSMTPETARFLEEISRSLEDNLRSNPFWSDGAFKGIVGDALQDLETNLRSRN